jgi:hypothetical protein
MRNPRRGKHLQQTAANEKNFFFQRRPQSPNSTTSLHNPPPSTSEREVSRYNHNMRLDDGQIEVMDDAMVDVYRRMTPWQRVLIGFDMWDYTRERVEAAVRWQHPEWDETAIQREFRRRMLREPA